ncbi:hypothetical protein C1S70_31025 (plasmid) [Azospirillum argentinense]|uniref:Calcineurin-like phosphoesterase domain-containing protein n=1 Tax=Azospirillum argentinense TaxID=2970906 RepID=A0A2K1FR85_9PROT|nr:metallophosphoesterase [Azospirillum argentinense]PNQ95040.1 hypothetical protein C1S70_31025 [Azospirillum argentinense]
MERIVTGHISDLHFGRHLSGRHFAFAKGYRQHDMTLCDGLTGTMRRLPGIHGLGREEVLRVVCSGDVTANGLLDEFIVGNTFLRSHFRQSYGMPPIKVGLALPDTRFAAVPGNHDHWNGNNLLPPYRTSIAANHFEQLPWRQLWCSPQKTLELELFGLDSNLGSGGSQPGSKNRIFAQGALSKPQLDELEELMRSSPSPGENTKRVRGIVLHHSLSYKGGILPNVVAPKILPKRYADALLDLMVRQNVSVLLTGHTHDPNHQPIPHTFGGTTHIVHELRSPATLQGPASRTHAGFLVHQVSLETDQVIWRTWHYRWTTQMGFQVASVHTPWRKFILP